MDFSSLLNEKQLEAVSSSAQYLRIVAGAGSGKTRVLTYRIAHLIVNEHVDPGSILAIAFTNKVAREMADRASKLVNDLTGHEIGFALKIMTFHSFCARFLRIEHEAFDYPSGFTIYDEDDQKKLVKDVAVAFGYKKGDEIVKNALGYIRKKKGRGLYPDDINASNIFSSDERECLKIYRGYEEAKKAAYGLDFDDLLLVASKILLDYPEIREKWQSRFTNILVDEFQDVNDIQFSLIKLIASPSASVYVVGDPDQTIYTWRGANQKIIMDFEKTFVGAKTVILNENYRSTSKILGAANELIAHNKNRIPKDLFTNQGSGDDIVAYCAPRSNDEAEWVARRIKECAREHRLPSGDPDYTRIAVLYRSSYLTRPFEQEFKDAGIPYKIYGGLRFYERMEVKDLLSYFNLMMNPLDNVAFERVANVPRRGVGEGSLERLRLESREHGLSEYQYLLSFEGEKKDGTDIPKKALTSLLAMVKKIEETKLKLDENLEAYSQVLQDFAKDIGYYDYVAEVEDIDEDRLGNVNALFEDIAHYLSAHPESNFSEYLQNVSLLTSQDDMKGGNYVSLMTVHVAKGLEFDYVFVIGLNDKTFPSYRSLEERDRDAMEEERRLCYVAITRARKKLFLSCNTSYSYQTDTHLSPSPFFKEAGVKLPFSPHFDASGWPTGYKKNSFESYSFVKKKDFDSRFRDEDPFESNLAPAAPAKKEPDHPKDNGIRDWKVGDICLHGKFGRGTVSKVLDGNIIVVDFEKEGKKTLVGSHYLISRVSRGGEA